MTDSQRSYAYASLVLIATFASVAIDTGIIPHFEAVGRGLGADSTSMLNTLTLFNGALVGGLLFGSLFSDPGLIQRMFLGSAVLFLVGGVLACVTDTMPVWLSAWALLGFGSGLLSHVSWEFTLNGGHSSLVMTRMISAQLSARPAALALGVPAFALLSGVRGWSLSLALFCVATTLVSIVLGSLSGRATAEVAKQPSADASLLKHYKSLRHPVLAWLLGGHFLYGMSYLGLYGVLGILLATLFQLSPEQVAYVYGALGAVEAASAFISPALFKVEGRTGRVGLVGAFSILSLATLAAALLVPVSSTLFVGLLAIFVFSARQIIFASFKAAPKAIAEVAPNCPVGTFAIMAAWSGFSLSTFLLEVTFGRLGLTGCAALLIFTYVAGIFCFSKFFRFQTV